MSAHDIKWLLSPFDEEVFFSDYWERKPLLLQERLADYFSDVFTISDVDDLISSASLPADSVRVVNGPDHVKKDLFTSNDGLIDPIELCKLFRQGNTIILNHVHCLNSKLMSLCEDLTNDIGLAFHTNLYLTPPNSQGFVCHYDTHDVFILQIFGEKLWRLFDSPYPLPLPAQYHFESGVEASEVESEVVLKSGELIYIPRGYFHSAECLESASLHITLGIHSLTWSEFFLDIVSIACTKDERLRESLPIRLLKNLDAEENKKTKHKFEEKLKILIDCLDYDELIKDFYVEVNSRVRPRMSGLLKNAMMCDHLTMTSVVVRSCDLMRIKAFDDIIEIVAFEKAIRLPKSCENEIRTLLSGSAVSLETAQFSLDEQSTITLTKRLVSEGLLRIVAIQPTSPRADIQSANQLPEASNMG